MWSSGIKGGGIASASLYVKRAGVVDYDRSIGDFTRDDTWRELDLSDVVPAGTQLIHCTLMLYPQADSFKMMWRSADDTTGHPIVATYADYQDKERRHEFMLPCNADRVVDYQGNTVAINTVNLTVIGYVLRVTA